MQNLVGKKTAEKGNRYRPLHGRDFDIKALAEYEASKTRNDIGKVLLAAIAVALLIAAAYGFHSGNFGGLASVWAVAGPVVGAVTAHYFRGGKG